MSKGTAKTTSRADVVDALRSYNESIRQLTKQLQDASDQFAHFGSAIAPTHLSPVSKYTGTLNSFYSVKLPIGEMREQMLLTMIQQMRGTRLTLNDEGEVMVEPVESMWAEQVLDMLDAAHVLLYRVEENSGPLMDVIDLRAETIRFIEVMHGLEAEPFVAVQMHVYGSMSHPDLSRVSDWTGLGLVRVISKSMDIHLLTSQMYTMHLRPSTIPDRMSGRHETIFEVTIPLALGSEVYRRLQEEVQAHSLFKSEWRVSAEVGEARLDAERNEEIPVERDEVLAFLGEL